MSEMKFKVMNNAGVRRELLVYNPHKFARTYLSTLSFIISEKGLYVTHTKAEWNFNCVIVVACNPNT